MNPHPCVAFCHFVIKALKPRNSAHPKVLETLGDRLRAKRMDLGLYQKHVAKLLGVTMDTICYWENSRVKPSPQVLPKIVQFLQED